MAQQPFSNIDFSIQTNIYLEYEQIKHAQFVQNHDQATMQSVRSWGANTLKPKRSTHATGCIPCIPSYDTRISLSIMGISRRCPLVGCPAGRDMLSTCFAISYFQGTCATRLWFCMESTHTALHLPRVPETMFVMNSLSMPGRMEELAMDGARRFSSHSQHQHVRSFQISILHTGEPTSFLVPQAFREAIIKREPAKIVLCYCMEMYYRNYFFRLVVVFFLPCYIHINSFNLWQFFLSREGELFSTL